jgi:hypothetical protein
MTPPDVIDPEEFWSEVLSEDPARVQDALRSLPSAERAGVRDHLQAMAEDAGWSAGQRRRARAALVAIQDTELG